MDVFFKKVFDIESTTYHRIFTTQKIEDLKEAITKNFYYIFLVGYY